MSECVVRMEMPKSCAECRKRWLFAKCSYYTGSVLRRSESCPIICQLPEGHGDLIDRAATINAILGEPPDAHYQSWYAEIVNDIPTIVPAERKVE